MPKVLIIDDEQSIFDILVHMLKALGISPVWLPTGEEALVQKTLQDHPDIIGVLQDWSGISRGLENAKLFAQIGMSVVIMSGREVEMIRSVLSREAVRVDGVISKPFRFQVIQDLVEKWQAKTPIGH